MKLKFPEFRSKFLAGICAELEGRKKALNYRGNLSFYTDGLDDFEWITIYYSFASWPYLEMRLVEDNRVSLFVRSSTRKERAKKLFSIEDVFVVNHPQRVVETFEWTIGVLYLFERGGENTDLCKSVSREWMKLSLRSVGD